MKKLTVQLAVAVFLTISGMVLIFSGFWVSPRGEIHNSVLVAFGEVSTFAGALSESIIGTRYESLKRRR